MTYGVVTERDLASLGSCDTCGALVPIRMWQHHERRCSVLREVADHASAIRHNERVAVLAELSREFYD